MFSITKTSISYPPKIPDTKTLDRCIVGMSYELRHHPNEHERERLRIILEEIKALKEAL